MTKRQISCPYCAAQGITMMASATKSKAIKDDETRYGCDNEHYFAIKTDTVLVKEPA